MYLKKLEINGFKSFADRTKIDFDHGITAVVGPNGSGKSNITEALRWALGEQSAKSLRGGKMPDVIFAGTEKRKAQNFAEVSAHFDNSDHYLGSDEAALAVTRRLYRNGDSEFLINGKKKRLKDIHDLFLDTGLGRDSFSIISQGRIESVFSSKAEERRAIIEEAAGVLKFKTRKAETESKLKSMQDNLDRLEDILYELSGQLPSLKAQRDVALQFQELDQDRETLALSLLLAQVKQKRTHYDRATIELKAVLTDLEALAASQQAFEAASRQLKNQRDEADEAREALQKQILALTELKSELEKKLARIEREAEDQAKSEATKLEQIASLSEEKTRLSAALAENQSRLSAETTQKAKLDQEIALLEKELAAYAESPEVQMEQLRERYLQLVNQESALSNQLTKNEADSHHLLRQQAESDSSNQENLAKLTKLTTELSALEADYAAQKAEIDQILADFQSQTEALKVLQIEKAAAESSQYQALERYNKAKAQVHSLENIRENHSNLYAGVRAAMRANLSGLIGVVADLLSFDSQYETALEVALGGGAQNIVTEDEQSAQAAIRYLRENKQGRATFLPLTTIKSRDFRDYAKVAGLPGFIDLASNLVSFDERLRGAISSLLGTTIIVDNGEHATAIARAMNFSVRIVTLDGTLLSPGGSYSGGSRQNRNNSTFIANEIEQLKQELSRLETELTDKEKASQFLVIKEKELIEHLGQLRLKGEDKRLAEKETELKVKQLSGQKADLEELLALSSSPESEQLLSQIKAQNSQIERELLELTSAKTQVNHELDQVRSSAEARNSLLAEKSASLTNSKVEVSKVNSELNFSRSEHSRLTSTLGTLEQRLGSLSQLEWLEIDEAERSRLVSQLSETSQKLESANVEQVSWRFAREDLLAQLEDLESQNHSSITALQELHDRKTRLELQLEQLEEGLRSAQIRLTEEHQLSFDEAELKASLIEEADLAQAEKNLRSLERQIRGLGPINLEAISQFSEVSERHDFLNSQKDDLLEAKNLLVATMTEMDDEVRVRFKATYDAVRSSFKETFAQMFGGGEADLVLTSDNLLEAGIDILAQPPGKRLGSLTLMSGGEKALTALALLFAILRVRTVPFVVLDEVEAALDEANVKRFGDYMNHFDNSNQFIVVTHRKGTMAAAKVMYGVTMSEAGVSKIVSVRFEDK